MTPGIPPLTPPSISIVSIVTTVLMKYLYLGGTFTGKLTNKLVVEPWNIMLPCPHSDNSSDKVFVPFPHRQAGGGISCYIVSIVTTVLIKYLYLGGTLLHRQADNRLVVEYHA